MTLSLGSCHIYKKYETPDSTALTAEYKQARQAEPDSTAFGNLLWEDVFTDPVLVDLINRALAENTSLRNAQLNVEIADAQLRGARLAYLPSLALTPNGAGASYAGSDLSWTYTIPASASWEIDVFAKLLNSKRGAQVAVYKSEAYAQAVRSRIIAGVANCYYAIASVERQLHLYRTTAQLWKESVQMMKDMKEAGRTTEAAVVQMTANYNNVLAGITDLEVSLDQLNNTMSLLMNTMPQTWAVSPDASLQVPEMLIQGVPMQYLAMRPDVAAAEQDLAVAYYATNSARAAFYPGITISAQGGFTNLLGSFVKNPGDWFYNHEQLRIHPAHRRGRSVRRPHHLPQGHREIDLPRRTGCQPREIRGIHRRPLPVLQRHLPRSNHRAAKPARSTDGPALQRAHHGPVDNQPLPVARRRTLIQKKDKV